jgi:formate C-acetyltransferase
MATARPTAPPLTDSLEALKSRILQGDNAACFSEREAVLCDCEKEALELPTEPRYTFQLRRVLETVSTPLAGDEVFAGRAVEAVWDRKEPFSRPPGGLASAGHLTLDWETLLRRGLAAIAADIHCRAESLGTPAARQFAANARLCVEAVAVFARRYSQTAQELAEQADDPAARRRMQRLAAALGKVPMQPAQDLFSALQSIWLVHFITSCIIGSRDFAFGHMDQYLLPYLEADLARGALDREQAVGLLAHFLLKSNEITGTATWNHKSKPTPCQATKQYLMLGGKGLNLLSELIVEAAERVAMPQPTLTFLLSASAPASSWQRAGRAAVTLGPQTHFYNHDLIMAALQRRGLPETDARNYTMIGCCRLEITHKTSPRMDRNYAYLSAPFWLYRALHRGNLPPGQDAQAHHKSLDGRITGMDDILARFAEAFRQDLAARRNQIEANDRQQQPFHFESLLIDNGLLTCRDCYVDGAAIAMEGIHIGSIATVGDSLTAIDQLVYQQKRFSLAEFMDIVDANFQGHASLRAEILTRLPRFGNDQAEADAWSVKAAQTLLDVLEEGPAARGTNLVLAGFYSLDTHHAYGAKLPATPDGRLAGEPLSENQSPVYGEDRQGLTSLLRSVARLPLGRAPMGGLNVRIVGDAEPSRIADTIRTYFHMGGLHLGLSFLRRHELEQARLRPEQYKSLLVRMYGFSEYFVSLSPAEQQEVIRRTEY